MVPTTFHLQHVVASLIERLDGMRRSFPDRESALRGMQRAAEEHLAAVEHEIATAPFLAAGGEAHAVFLRREVLETFLPRFVDAAASITAAERAGYGVGRLADPIGRIGLALVSLMVLWGAEIRLSAIPVMWPIILVTFALPFLPDILGRMERGRYEGALQAMLVDMERIQANAHLPAAQRAPLPEIEAPGHAGERAVARPSTKTPPETRPETPPEARPEARPERPRELG